MNASSPPEVWPRIVNGIVVIAVIAIAAYVFSLLGGTIRDSSFGAFTTLVGTAIAAYFGISATREAGRTALDAVSASADQGKKIQAARDVLATNAAADHPVVNELRKIIGP